MSKKSDNLSIVFSRATIGIIAPLVTVEAHLCSGLPGFSIVGLPETAVKESKDRIRSAIINSGFIFPLTRIVINLAPADLPKEGGRFDLPIALGILAASGQIPKAPLKHFECAAELSLSGALCPVSGILPSVLAAQQANKALLIAQDNLQEASLYGEARVLGAQDLQAVCAYFNHNKSLETLPTSSIYQQIEPVYEDLSDIQGQEQAKRALSIAASGGHSLLLSGAPGCGKTLLASRLPALLPPLSREEAVQVAALYSLKYTLGTSPLAFKERPFRTPHHSISAPALLGGGSKIKPGEVSLAHHGVLFLDELPEFSRQTLESLREPLELKQVHVSRAREQVSFPAHFQLIAAMNPCPCGYLGESPARCRCTPHQIQRYQARISGPLLDRIDLHLSLPKVSPSALLRSSASSPKPKQGLSPLQHQIRAARDRQIQRANTLNMALEGQALEVHCALSLETKDRLISVVEKLQLSARAVHRVLRVARTIADMEESPRVKYPHLAEALQYRSVISSPMRAMAV